VEEHGDWAEVELLEIYENQTGDQQEVLYYFNLPESAVLTGLWLGNSEDRDSRFTHVVAPRGAAQAAYRNEKRIRIDPALLEQIGPRQYRLRVFPIPPLRMNWNENRTRQTVEKALPLYLWLTYSTMASGDAWPLPRLAEKRNVYWDRDTPVLINGEPTKREEDAWLPESVSATGSTTQRAHHIELPGGRTVTAVPKEQVELPGLPEDVRIAIVLDRSRSMAEYAPQVSEVLADLERTNGPETDIYLTSSPYRGEEPSVLSLGYLNTEDLLYFGGQNPAELLAQFEELRAGRHYDAVVVLSDGSGYELGESQAELPLPSAPVWIVHLDSDIPLGYDDPTLEYIQASGGGVVGDVDQALERLTLSLAAPSGQPGGNATSQDVLDGYVWTVQDSAQISEATDETAFAQDDGGFAAIAARRVVLEELRDHYGQLGDLQVLDALHALAEDSSIVTPYSSMIVLVTESQLARLERLESASDRYDREYEAVGETTPISPLPLTGVPEPHEWLLLGLAAALLLCGAYKRMPGIHGRQNRSRL
jgi:putative PEP-CTERM system integral membrane protein